MTTVQPDVSVAIATYNRLPLLKELLATLDVQTLAADAFEVVVVDDGSKTPVRADLEAEKHPYALRVIEQKNAGAAAARHAAIQAAKGRIVVIVDDDMLVGPTFLAEHKRAHDDGATLVLGKIEEEEALRTRKPLFERFHAYMLERQWNAIEHDNVAPRGVHVCTGNVSFRRDAYLAVGGFDRSLDRSEDRELGVRLEKAGARLAFSKDARTINRSDHVRLDVWLKRAFLYGIYDRRISSMHPDVDIADPWHFFFLINPVSRPLVAVTVAFPSVGKVLSRVVMATATTVDKLGAERVGIAGATLCYGLEYFRGVRTDAGSLFASVRDAGRYLQRRKFHAKG